MVRGRKRKGSGLSVKSQRVLEAWGVERAMAAGMTLVSVGPTYQLSDDRTARLAFTRDDAGKLCVGYAVECVGRWEIVDCRAYSARTLAYFQRRLKRVGRRADLIDDDSDPD